MVAPNMPVLRLSHSGAQLHQSLAEYLSDLVGFTEYMWSKWHDGEDSDNTLTLATSGGATTGGATGTSETTATGPAGGTTAYGVGAGRPSTSTPGATSPVGISTDGEEGARGAAPLDTEDKSKDEETGKSGLASKFASWGKGLYDRLTGRDATNAPAPNGTQIGGTILGQYLDAIPSFRAIGQQVLQQGE
ncbi:hypothetical protein IAR55_005311 [Kwoniella newhampshirensis]|uniref:Uncharacterized protein n=1 Tax=Kwoniella newhampshirensis TaxID=1651941 RepID=A0AAW0YTJ1_9TREE